MKKFIASFLIWAFTILWIASTNAGNVDSWLKSSETKLEIILDKVESKVSEIFTIPSTEAYTFSMTGWLVVEDADVDDVGEKVGVWITSYLQILKYLWIAILVWVSTLIVNKVFGIAKVG